MTDAFAAPAYPTLPDHESFLVQELRSCLTPIQGVAHLLDRQSIDLKSATGQRLIEMVQVNTRRLLRLTETLEGEAIPTLWRFSTADASQLRLMTDLLQAWQERQFQLFYQPIVDLSSGCLRGFEGLLRWDHPRLGQVPPDQFIPLVEKMGLIGDLGLWVIEAALLQLHCWQELAPESALTMSVNLSPLQLTQPDLVKRVSAKLAQYSFVPGSLTLEITESALIENYEAVSATLTTLKTLGVNFSIDDFGTGYSSLSRLSRLPVSGLKVDRSFVHNQDWQVIQAVILIARSFDMEVIVEGIETAEEMARLQQFGNLLGQGYWFSKPVPAAAATALLNLPLGRSVAECN